MASEYRARLFGRPLGPWRMSSAEAMRDAVNAGEATWDAERQVHFLHAGADIEFARYGASDQAAGGALDPEG